MNARIRKENVAATESRGPLAGVRIIEFASIGPAPFAVMLLADLGAEVVRVRRAGSEWPEIPIVTRGRSTLDLDLKSEGGRNDATSLAGAADILIEGYRPGVMERLGLGPDRLLQLNPRLIYGRMTGWGQRGPLSASAGHDLNFVGLAGMLEMLAPKSHPPRAPQNLLGDYAGGGLYLALGALAALHEREKSGRGQVIDAAIIDGCASLLAPILGMVAAEVLPHDPSQGMLAGDASYYRTYACSDGRFIAVAALEKRFRDELAKGLGVAVETFESASGATELEAIFASRPRDEWVELFASRDCCVTPVLELDEARFHPHNLARSNFVGTGESWQPAPAPRFSRTPVSLPSDVDALDRLQEWGIELGAFER